MTKTGEDCVHVFSQEELRAMVVPRRAKSMETSGVGSEPKRAVRSVGKHGLSADAEAFLRLAARTPGRSQKELFEALGITSGSKRNAVVEEVLFRHAFVRRGRHGRSWLITLTEAGYDYLGMEAPKGRGVGGSL